MTPLLSRTSCSLFLVASLIPVSAFAQDSPKVGLVMGYPAAISVIWHASEQIAIRPEITFSGASSGSSSIPGLEADQFSVNPGVSALFYLAKWDAVRTYVSPRYLYQHSSTSSSSSILGPLESTATTHSFAGSFGAEFNAHRRFAVFGEVGLQYSRAAAETLSVDGPTLNAWNVRSAVGVIFYFK